MLCILHALCPFRAGLCRVFNAKPQVPSGFLFQSGFPSLLTMVDGILLCLQRNHYSVPYVNRGRSLNGDHSWSVPDRGFSFLSGHHGSARSLAGLRIFRQIGLHSAVATCSSKFTVIVTVSLQYIFLPARIYMESYS